MSSHDEVHIPAGSSEQSSSPCVNSQQRTNQTLAQPSVHTSVSPADHPSPRGLVHLCPPAPCTFLGPQEELTGSLISEDVPPIIIYKSKQEAENDLNLQQRRNDSKCPGNEALHGHYFEQIWLTKEKFKVEYISSIHAMIQTLFFCCCCCFLIIEARLINDSKFFCFVLFLTEITSR